MKKSTVRISLPEHFCPGGFGINHKSAQALDRFCLFAHADQKLWAFSLVYLLIAIQLGSIPVDAAQEHIPVPEFHELGTSLLMKGHHTALGIYPQLPDRFPVHHIFHSECVSFHIHTWLLALLCGPAAFLCRPEGGFDHCTYKTAWHGILLQLF